MGVTPELLKLMARRRDAAVVEIGVAQGESAEQIAGLDSVKSYTGIDPWLHYDAPPDGEFGEGYLDRKMGLWATQGEWDSAYGRAQKRVQRFGDKVQLIRGFSHEVCHRIGDDLDVVYVDGNHQYQYVLRDLEVWYPKLKEGGLMIGDDFDFGGGALIDGKWGGAQSCQVKRAVEDFCKARGLNYYVIDGNFVIHKPYEHLLRFKDLHKGERVFLIGNGPSLNRTNLDLIKNDHAIAMNRISLIYPRTQWRPDYYLYTADNINNKIWGDKWQTSVNAAISEPGTTSFVWRLFADRVQNNPNIVWLDNVTELDIGEAGTFSTNIAQWVSKTGTSMNVAFQLANFMGFEQIFLLGCDLNWKTSSGTERDPNHFDPSYSAKIPDGERERLRMRTTHENAYRFLKAEGRHVYNATVGSLLDVYPLADFRAVARNSNWQGQDRDECCLPVIVRRLLMLYYWRLRRPLRSYLDNKRETGPITARRVIVGVFRKSARWIASRMRG